MRIVPATVGPSAAGDSEAEAGQGAAGLGPGAGPDPTRRVPVTMPGPCRASGRRPRCHGAAAAGGSEWHAAASESDSEAEAAFQSLSNQAVTDSGVSRPGRHHPSRDRPTVTARARSVTVAPVSQLNLT